MRPAILLLAVVLALPGPALGKERPPPRPPTSPAGHSRGTARLTSLPVTGIALGSWLDDADTLEPGVANWGLSIGRWSALDGGETYAALDVGAGILGGVQASASVPYYRASYADGFQASGLGDSYFIAKLRLVDPGKHVVGLAVSPMLEVLSQSALSDTSLGLSRLNWVLPVSVEVNGDETRGYATAGYFSRGAVSAGAALERTVTKWLTLLATVTYSRTTHRIATTDLVGLGRSRTDAAAGLYLKPAASVTVFGSIGRTVSQLDQSGARLNAHGGVSVVVGKARPRS
jgi:hypothetical protein